MKKRSLFVATAMLLVAVLVATGATYAWFQSDAGAATAQISMNVSKSSKLEMNTDLMNGAWSQTLTTADLFGPDTDITRVWNDYTTTKDNIIKLENQFWEESWDNQGDANVVETGINIKTTKLVNFRSTQPGNVFVTKGDLFSIVGTSGTADTRMINAARVAFCDLPVTTADATGYKVFAGGTDADTADYDITSVADANAVVVTMTTTPDANGFYTGQAIVHCWLEGTDETNCLGAYANMTKSVGFDCTFGQEGQTANN